MKTLLKCAAITGAVLTCTVSPALADDEYTTDQIAPSWTAGSAESCADPETSPLLAAFKDDDFYAPAPGGTFEAGAAGWQLEGGASVVATPGDRTVTGTSDAALELPVGSTATSPTFCVDERYPHFRFLLAQATEKAEAEVRVEVLYPGLADKNVRKAKDLKAKYQGHWELTDRIKLEPLHGLKKGGGWRLVAIRLHVKDGKAGSVVRVDDVLVDPRARA